MNSEMVKWMVGAMASLLCAAAGAGGVAAVARAKLDATVQDVAALKARQEPDAAWHQHVEDHFQAIDGSLDRLERHLGTK